VADYVTNSAEALDVLPGVQLVDRYIGKASRTNFTSLIYDGIK
jgi:hypothetical protein